MVEDWKRLARYVIGAVAGATDVETEWLASLSSGCCVVVHATFIPRLATNATGPLAGHYA